MSPNKKPIHHSIKTCLGYEPDMSDVDFLADWKKRASHVCKPCWELKYCPYGPFVEQSPLLPSTRDSKLAHQARLKEILESGYIGERICLDDEQREIYVALIKGAKENPAVLASKVSIDIFMQEISELAEKEGKNILEYLQPPLKDFEKFKNPYPFEEDTEIDTEGKLPEVFLSAIQTEIKRMEDAVSSGFDDKRKPLDPARKKLFEIEINEFSPEDSPEEIPQIVSEMECNIFGHICPVVFVGEAITETSDKRRRGRYIPFKTKMRVVRRDNHTCQECGKHLKDDEVEFDHIIPHAKGGSCEEHNLRLTCYDCNRGKSDTVEI